MRLAVVIVAAAFAGCANAATTPSGLHGVVLQGPVHRPDRPLRRAAFRIDTGIR